MAGHDDYSDDPLLGSHHAADSLERRQLGEFEAMLSDVDDRLARRIAYYVAQRAGITDEKHHRKHHEWITRQVSRCDWWSDAISNAGRSLVTWGAIGVAGMMLAFLSWVLATAAGLIQ